MKKYAIYGDDDQQRLNEIFEDEENIQYLVDQANKKTMINRKKEASKKKVLDTTVNNERPGEVNDIEQGNPIEKKKLPKNKETNKQKEKNPKTKKKLVIIFVLILLIVIAFSTIFTLFGDEAKDLYSQVVNSNKNNQTDIIDINNNDGVIDNSTYSFSDIVRVSQEMNSYLQSYYTDIQEIIKYSKESNPENLINDLKTKVENDYSRFVAYESHFALYEGGSSFYKSLSERFDNIRGLIVSIGTVNDNNMMYTLIKNAIDVENQLIVKGKNELINFFEANNVEYKDKDTSVVFEVK